MGTVRGLQSVNLVPIRAPGSGRQSGPAAR